MPRNLEHHVYQQIHHLRQQHNAQRSKKVAFVLFVALFAGLIYWTRDQSPVPVSPQSIAASPEPNALPLPTTGTVNPAKGQALGQLRLFLSPPIAADDSTLKDECPANTLMQNKLNYFVKVVDWKSNQTIATGFVRAGEKVILNVPPGTYKLRYAAGMQWYGDKHLFGNKTRYGEVLDSVTTLPIQFKFDSNGIGWDLGLYRCNAGGNITTKDLNPKDF